MPTDCGLPIVATHSYADAWTDPDVVFVGGAGAPTMRMIEDADALAFLATRGGQARLVTSVCTGSLILGAAGLLQGHRAACYWALRDRLAAFGVKPSSERVCVDCNRYS